MKKKLLGFFLLVILIISVWNSICLADAIDIEATRTFGDKTLSEIFPVGVSIITVAIISMIILTKLNKVNNKKIIQIFVSIIVFIILIGLYLSILSSFESKLGKRLSYNILYIPMIVLFVILFIALITSSFGKIKTSLFFVGISFLIVLSIGIGMKYKVEDIEAYNSQFYKYIKQENETAHDKMNPFYVADIEGLINRTIANNKGNKKTRIVLDSVEYTSPEELENLLSTINNQKMYYVLDGIPPIYYSSLEYKYDYLKEIVINSLENLIIGDAEGTLVGNKIRGSNVIKLIENVEGFYQDWSGYLLRFWKLKIIYKSKNLSIYINDKKEIQYMNKSVIIGEEIEDDLEKLKTKIKENNFYSIQYTEDKDKEEIIVMIEKK